MNDNDQMILKQSRNTLLGEWGFVLSIPHAQAEIELYRLLAPPPPAALDRLPDPPSPFILRIACPGSPVEIQHLDRGGKFWDGNINASW